MKKKAFLLAALAILLAAPLSAGWRFDLFATKPLHDVYLADKNRPAMSLDVSVFSDMPTFVITGDQGHGGIETTPLNAKFQAVPANLVVNVGETLGLLRSTFTFDHWLSPVAFDLSAQFLLKNVMDYSVSKSVGLDGVYFIGATGSVADRLSFRVGMHHYSGQVGKEALANMDACPADRFKRFATENYIYMRMNAFVVGLSIKPVEGIRLYGELNMLTPWITECVKPFMNRPSWLDFHGHSDWPEEYKARIISCGVELSYPIFKKLGKTTIAYDLHLHEDGKIIYRGEDGAPVADDSVHYDPDAPWEMEHGVVLNQRLGKLIEVELAWRRGRYIANNFFWQRTDSWTVALRLDFDGAARLFEIGR